MFHKAHKSKSKLKSRGKLNNHDPSYPKIKPPFLGTYLYLLSLLVPTFPYSHSVHFKLRCGTWVAYSPFLLNPKPSFHFDPDVKPTYFLPPP